MKKNKKEGSKKNIHVIKKKGAEAPLKLYQVLEVNLKIKIKMPSFISMNVRIESKEAIS